MWYELKKDALNEEDPITEAVIEKQEEQFKKNEQDFISQSNE